MCSPTDNFTVSRFCVSFVQYLLVKDKDCPNKIIQCVWFVSGTVLVAEEGPIGVTPVRSFKKLLMLLQGEEVENQEQS